MRYGIWDPTGNITALVESAVEVGEQPAAASCIMARHPEVEQVGFVRHAAGGEPCQAELRMAGGEFCGNATMCAAAWHLSTQGLVEGEREAVQSVHMRVSGASQPVLVSIRERAGEYEACVHMPKALALEEVACASGGVQSRVPLVRMEGISHLVIEEGSALFCLRDDRASAERAVRSWCEELGADGLGLMFLGGEDGERRLDPLVYVPGGDTVFWERSCASGSSAVGMWLAARSGGPVDVSLREPGGVLRVESDSAGETLLYGRTRIVGTHVL